MEEKEFGKEIFPEDIGLESDEILFGDQEATEEATQEVTPEATTEELSIFQKIYLEDNEELEEDKEYPASITNVYLEYTSNKKIPVIKLECEVTACEELKKPKKVEVDFALDEKNSKYLTFTLNRLRDLLNLAKISLNQDNFKDVNSIFELSKQLIGKKVSIYKENYKNFPKYYISNLID